MGNMEFAWLQNLSTGGLREKPQLHCKNGIGAASSQLQDKCHQCSWASTWHREGHTILHVRLWPKLNIKITRRHWKHKDWGIGYKIFRHHPIVKVLCQKLQAAWEKEETERY